MVRLAGILLAVLLLAACGQLPRPFQPVDKSGNELLRLKDRAGIVVRPVLRDAPGRPAEAAEILATKLRERNLPASTRDLGRASRVLTGRAAVLGLPAGREEVMVYWELRDASSGRVGAYAQRTELAPGAWRSGDPESVGKVMDDAATVIAAMVQGAPVKSAALPEVPRKRLEIVPMQGLPGDGAASLSRALTVALRAADLPLAERPGDGEILIVCNVVLGPAQGSWQEVKVNWAVIRASDGSELGRIDQQNRVPLGSLNGPWGPAAHGIAEGAALGIKELVERLSQPI